VPFPDAARAATAAGLEELTMAATAMIRERRSVLLLASLIAGLAAVGCKVDEPPSQGDCTLNTALSCDSNILAGNPDAGASLGLVGYSCTGTARPDALNAKYIAGIPSGMVCAERGPSADGTSFDYCCTPPDQPVACAFYPVAICPDKNYGFQCRGADRPEALNPALTCGNGIRDGQLVDYCCAAQPRPDGCTENKGTCSGGLTGWHCPPDAPRPRGEDFGANESRADYYYFVCSVPVAAPDGSSTYCCFTPAPLLPGGSCVTATNVQSQIPDCVPGRFGFACYGRETPEQDYLPIHCSEAPIQGVDDNLYPATLYCCDYRKPNGGVCTSGDECLSGDCTEGFCCALASCPSCYSCAITGVPGTCRLVPMSGADPTGQCANGCNGNGGCL
jgi:hypothetical protein